MITWIQWLKWACLKLKKSCNPRREAEILLGKTINKSRAQLLAFGETILKHNEVIILKSLINRRRTGEPIAYLIGSKEFWSLNFQVSSETFIPRPDTECLVEQVLHLLPMSNLKVLDLGTGVGTIALALATERPQWDILGIDRQKKALSLAYKNKLSLNLKNANFMYGDWFKYLKRKFNLIVSNPPYIKKNDSCWLINDMHFEPKNALISAHFGLKDLIIISQCSIQYLYPNGWLFVEHGWDQGKYVRVLFRKSGFNNINTVLDYHGYERVTYGQWIPNICFK